MASIQTGIELNDQFSGVIYGIINAVNLTVSTMEDMQHTMNADMDTSGIKAVRDEINQATIAMDELNAAMQNQSLINTDSPVPQTVPSIPDPTPMPEQSRPPPEPVEIPVTWDTDDLEVFTGTGIERFQQEVQSTNSMLEQLSSTQNAIASQAYNTNLFPLDAFQNLNRLATRIDLIRDRIQQIENNPVNIGTGTANAELEQLRSRLNQAVLEQNELNTAMQSMDVSAANAAYLHLSQTISGTERYIRDNVDEQGRFNQEIQEGIQQANGLTGTIMKAVGAYVSIQGIGNVLNISDELVQTTSRLNMMNDGMQSTQELVNMVYAAAQDARGSFSEMADVVARFGNNAGDAFSSSEEVVAFADLVQKQMTIAGAGTQEASNAMLQLSQALGSGVLRGDELNSIFEQAPNLIQSIADYLDVPIGKIREMAADGELSADVVKAAIFSAADDINSKFNEMPMTWGQMWQSMQNTALIAFQPVLQRLNDIANSESFQGFVDGAIEAMATLANIVLNIFDLIGTVGSFIADNWSIISPIVYGVIGALAVYATYLGMLRGIELASAAASTIYALAMSAKVAVMAAATGQTMAAAAAQMGYNGALYACPIVWIIMLIIALIAIIFAVCNAIAKMTGIANSGFGVITGGVNIVIQFFKNLALTVANIALGIGGAVAALGQNIVVVFNNAISNAQTVFYNLLSTAMSVISQIASALSKLPFVDFDASGLVAAADNYATKAAEAQSNKMEYTSISDAFSEGFNTFDAFQDGWVSDAFDAGASWGDGVADAVNNFNLSDIFGGTNIPNPQDYVSGFDDAIMNAGVGDNLGSIADNTGAIKDSLGISEEDLKYLRDMAEQEIVNRYTVAEITIDQSGMQNNINSGDDIDGFMTKLTDSVNEAVDNMTEGVHE